MGLIVTLGTNGTLITDDVAKKIHELEYQFFPVIIESVISKNE